MVHGGSNDRSSSTPSGHGSDGGSQEHRLLPADRIVFFTDAVVAIAMTLLILPLLESIAEAGHEQQQTTEWFSQHLGQFSALALGFILIATFWASHHAIFHGIETVPSRILWLNVVWMFCLVWLPVSTAMLGSQMRPDRLQFVLYVGPTLLASVLAYVMATVLGTDSSYWREGFTPAGHQRSVALALAIPLSVALLVMLAAPQVNYLAMFLLFLVSPLEKLLHRRIPHPRAVSP